MHPIYFPYTAIDRPTAVTLHACLGPVSVYQPSEALVPEALQQLAREGVVELRIPVKGDDGRLARLLKDFQSWAALQRSGKGIDADYLKTLQDRLPFHDDDATSRIRAHIKERLQDRSGVDADADPDEVLFKARLFLQLAQEFDLQSERVAADLARFSRMEGELLKDLHGGEAAVERMSSTKDIPGDPETTYYMLAERIDAWATLMVADLRQTGPNAGGLWVTANRDAAEWMAERCPELQKVVDVTIREGEHRWCDTLNALTSTDIDEGVRRMTQMPGDRLPDAASEDAAAEGPAFEGHVYAVPGKTPAAVLTALSPGAATIRTDATPPGTVRNTVIVVIRRRRA